MRSNPPLTKFEQARVFAACIFQHVVNAVAPPSYKIPLPLIIFLVLFGWMSFIILIVFFPFDVCWLVQFSLSSFEHHRCIWGLCLSVWNLSGQDAVWNQEIWDRRQDSVVLTAVHMVHWQLVSSETPLLLSKSHRTGQQEGNASVSV